MAKDGTMRGGPRANSGPKKKSLAEKVIEGRVELDSSASVLPEPVEIEGVDVPPVKDFLKAKQKNGKDFYAHHNKYLLLS
mgnify:CR=1 FL=1